MPPADQRRLVQSLNILKYRHRRDAMDKSEKQIDDEAIRPSDASQEDGRLVLDPQSEKRLVRKLDLWIAPVMTLIFLTAYLDRANIGNAASAGMTEDIGMSDGELGSESPLSMRNE